MTNLFTKEQYNSNNGFITHCWGPLMWNTLHIISFNYSIHPTNEDKDHYHNYLMSLGYILPCKSCRDSYLNNLKVANYNRNKLKDRDTFSRFIYELHNCVNKMLNRPKYLTYEAVRDRYEMMRAAKCINETPVGSLHKTLPKLGCTIPANNIKTMCIVSVVPHRQNQETFIVDKRLSSKSLLKTKKSSKKSSKSTGLPL